MLNIEVDEWNITLANNTSSQRDTYPDGNDVFPQTKGDWEAFLDELPDAVWPTWMKNTPVKKE